MDSLMMNKKKYEGLSEQHKRIINVALGDSITHVYADSEGQNFKAMQEMVSKHGVKIKRWPDATLALFEKAWREVVEEESAKDPIFKKVADSYFSYRANYKIWKDAQALKATYLDK